MGSGPLILWRSREIAELLGDVTLVATYRQLARWTKKGMIKRVARDATRQSHRKRPPCVTCKNANYPALGKLHLPGRVPGRTCRRHLRHGTPAPSQAHARKVIARGTQQQDLPA